MEVLQQRENLLEAASEDLLLLIQAAIASANSQGTEVHLAHIVDKLLGKKEVEQRLGETTSSAKQLVGEQITQLPKVTGSSGKLAFGLSPLFERASRLASEFGAERILPLTFLSSCLVESDQSDATTRQTQELLRAAGVTLERLQPTLDGDARRRDYTFHSLGYGTDLTEMARSGAWPSSPLVGMEPELRRLAMLLNADRGSVALVGEPGVGKSAFIQGFAYKIATRDRAIIPQAMDSWTVVMIESNDILAGTGNRGELENKIDKLLDFCRDNPTVIPFFEEMHRLFDASDASARPVLAALKPPMATGTFRCVGCTTDSEYAQFVLSDAAMNSRFRKIVLSEPSQEVTVEIIRGSKDNLLRGPFGPVNITLSDDAIDTAVRVTSAYQRTEKLPRKAINLLSQVVAAKAYEFDLAPQEPESREVVGDDVIQLFSEMQDIPAEDLVDDRAGYFDSVSKRLLAGVIGQDHAVSAVSEHLLIQSKGWRDPRRPRGRFLFAGPPGVGKTELATALAEVLMHDRDSLIVLNMGEYQGEQAYSKFMGSTAGYVGYGATSTIHSRVTMRANCVIVLDEYEKCHPSLAHPILSVLDGWAEDSSGRVADFSQCIIVLTSNVMLDGNETGSSENDEDLRSELKNAGGPWTNPLVDRLDRICLFQPLCDDDLLKILGLQIKKMRSNAVAPLPAQLDEAEVQHQIVADSQQHGERSSARGLERTLQRWLINHG